MELITHVNIPSLVRVKPGALDRLGLYLQRAGHSPAILLVSKGLVPGYLERAERSLDRVAAVFFNLAGAGLPGRLVEMNPTRKIFSNPEERATEAYISGRFG